MKKKTLIGVRVQIALLLVGFALAHSQNRTYDEIADQLATQVRGLFGEAYKADFWVLDSLIGTRANSSSQIVADPYHTLSGTVLFRAFPVGPGGEDQGENCAIGMFKNGQIVWHSDPFIDGVLDYVYGTDEINNDGKVEVLTIWSSNQTMGNIEYMAMFGWDGSTGRIINSFDVNGVSKILSVYHCFEIIDQDKDGVREIRARWGEDDYFPNDQISTRPAVTYSWNGTMYDIWPSTRQVPEIELLPSNQLIGSVKCVLSSDDSLTYDYVFSSDAPSKQSISKITVIGVTNAYTARGPADWEAWPRRYEQDGVFWLLPPRNPWIDQETGMIRPGTLGSGFQVRSKVPPGIVRCYLQGYRSAPSDFDPNISAAAYFQDLLTNSLRKITVGPVDPPSPFFPFNFLDTLTGYIGQSRSLGWMKDQTTSDKYIAYFASARTSLQQNNLGSARATLLQVLSDVNVDSSAKLTSEAYALIRYNTEYVVAKLPASTILFQ